VTPSHSQSLPKRRDKGEYLGGYLGTPDPLDRLRWFAAMNAGKLRRQCSATAKTGARCRKTALKFADRCRHHCQGRERDLTDEKRLPWLRSMALRFPGKRIQAERSIERILIRRLYRAWKLDPELPGATMRLGPGDEARVERWLIERGVILDDGQRTPQCQDRLRWAAFLSLGGKLDDQAARRRIEDALRDEERWRAKQTAARQAAAKTT
jgi:hypothetical protein